MKKRVERLRGMHDALPETRHNQRWIIDHLTGIAARLLLSFMEQISRSEEGEKLAQARLEALYPLEGRDGFMPSSSFNDTYERPKTSTAVQDTRYVTSLLSSISIRLNDEDARNEVVQRFQWKMERGEQHRQILFALNFLRELAAPLTDTADFIVDLVKTRTTLRENRLKLIADGTVMESQTCLIANARQLVEDVSALKTAETLLELIEARTGAKDRSMLTAQVKADNSKAIGRISIGTIHISVIPLTYRFAEASRKVLRLHERLKRVMH